MKKFLLTILLILIILPLQVQAQSDEDEYSSSPEVYIVDDDESFSNNSSIMDYTVPEDFTGTFAEDDPESEVYQEMQLFGEDNPEIEEEQIDGPTHLLKFEFNSQVIVTDTLTDVAFLEVNYELKLEQEIEVVDRRFRSKGRAEVVTDVVGTLAGNELFSCKLDIQLENVEADIMTRYTYVEETEENPAVSQLAIQIKFNSSSLEEDWFSNCLGVDGSMFNTKGEKEKYFLTILQAAVPNLTGLLLDNYVKEEDASLDVIAEPVLTEDQSTHEEYLMQGSGVLTIEMLE